MENEGQDNNSQQPVADNAAPAGSNLDSVRQRALDALTPIITNIQDMDPERKFDICITAMRYTDNKDLAETALQAALAIESDEAKASALVDLLNEINYLQQA